MGPDPNQGGFWKVGTEFTVQPGWKSKWKPIFEFDTTGAPPDGLWHMTGITIEDITSEKAAADSASAASSSYAAAEYQAGQAGQSAQAASGYANTAIVKAGESTASAAAAAGSAATANDRAAAASSSANLAATYSVGGGNLIAESSFETGIGDWSVYIASGTSGFEWGRDLAGDAWRPQGEHVLGIHQLDGNNSRSSQWNTGQGSCKGDTWYEPSGLTASHRCRSFMRIDWYDSNNQGIGSAHCSVNEWTHEGGQQLDSWWRSWTKVKSPPNARRYYLVFLKEGTLPGYGDSYAWLCRPMLRETYEAASGPSPYAPANGRASLANLKASYDQTVTVVAGLEGSAASFDQRLQVAEATVGQAMGAIQDINGKTTTFWQVYATGPNGETYVRLVNADGRSGFIVGTDLYVMGNAVIDGTINASALALDRFVRRVGGGGAGSPSPGQMLLLYADDIGVLRANGSYAFELSGTMNCNVGSSTSGSGKWTVNQNLPDGGLLARIMKGSTVLAEHYYSASEYASQGIASRTLSLATTKIFDAPPNDTVEGMATLLIYAIRGNADSGVVDEGDYFRRSVSAVYSNFSISTKLKWTFI